MKAKIITFGEIMLRLATPDHLRFHQATELEATFGGGESNVAVSLANYGMEVDFVTRLPENDIAESAVMIDSSLNAANCSCREQSSSPSSSEQMTVFS